MKSNFRRSNGARPNNGGHYQNNSNTGNNFSRNGSMTNPFNVEKTAQKFQQLAKDALTSGDPVLHENYLQHAEHFNRRLSELNSKHREPKEQKIEIKTENKQENKTENKIENISLAEKLNQKSDQKK